MNEVRRIILDTDLAMGDPGSEIDDGFALALAQADPGIQLELVTTVNGNTDVESATLLTRELLERLEQQQIPVVTGAAAPLLRPNTARGAPEHIRERYGRHAGDGGSRVTAAVEIVRTVMDNPGEITIVAIGPLTNVAVALSLEPAIAVNVREIVIMGGIFLGHTQQAAMPGEFNVWVDPEAADAVLHSGAPLRWVGLDVTLQVRLTKQHAERMSHDRSRFGSFAGEFTAQWIDRQRERHPGSAADVALADSCAMHDPLAVAVVTHPQFVTWSQAHVSVVTGDGVARGVMVTDLLSSADAPAPNCRIATAVDVDAFTAYFLDAIAALP
jgi:purine nucleosidase